MRKPIYYIEVYFEYMKISWKIFKQYPSDSAIWVLSMLLREIGNFFGVLIIANHMDSVNGWNIYELCILFSMVAMCEALSQAFLDSIWSIGEEVKRGNFDVYFTHPFPVFIQLVGSLIHFQAIISFLAALALLIFSCIKLGIWISVKKIFFVMEFLICGMTINSSIYLFFNSLNFWLIQGEDIAVFIQTLREVVKYPLSIFPVFVKNFFTFLIPFGFVGYYPACYFLGKIDKNFPILLIFIALITATLARYIWKVGIKNYESVGN